MLYEVRQVGDPAHEQDLPIISDEPSLNFVDDRPDNLPLAPAFGFLWVLNWQPFIKTAQGYSINRSGHLLDRPADRYRQSRAQGLHRQSNPAG